MLLIICHNLYAGGLNMDKTLQHKILAAVIAAGTLGLYTANPVNAENYYTEKKTVIL